jgi:hypothetical protein
MNIAVLLKALQYEAEVEAVVKVAGDIAGGHVGTTPELAQVKVKDNGKTYAVTVIAQEINDAKDPAVAEAAAAVDPTELGTEVLTG